VRKAYPELNFEEWTDERLPAVLKWTTERCRQFFDNYASEVGFDPLLPENWYSVKLHKLMKKKVKRVFMVDYL